MSRGLASVTGHGSHVNPKKFKIAKTCKYPFSPVRYCHMNDIHMSRVT